MPFASLFFYHKVYNQQQRALVSELILYQTFDYQQPSFDILTETKPSFTEY